MAPWTDHKMVCFMLYLQTAQIDEPVAKNQESTISSTSIRRHFNSSKRSWQRRRSEEPLLTPWTSFEEFHLNQRSLYGTFEAPRLGCEQSHDKLHHGLSADDDNRPSCSCQRLPRIERHLLEGATSEERGSGEASLPAVDGEEDSKEGRPFKAGGCDCYDGPNDEGPSWAPQKRGRKEEGGTQEEKGRDQKSQARGQKEAGSVKDRIRAYEERNVKRDAPPLQMFHYHKTVMGSSKQNGNDQQSTPSTAVPIVFPLHVRKFVRRTSAGNPATRPETPLYRSDPEDDLVIHAPLPRRTLPPLKTPPVSTPIFSTPLSHPITPPPSDALQNAPGMIDPAPPFAQDTSTPLLDHPSFGKPRVSPFAHFHGTREYCVRRGRKAGAFSASPFVGTKDMLDRGRNGVCFPTGCQERRQMDAISPWSVSDCKLTPATESAPRGQDACPDCVQELEIRKRELGATVDGSSTATMLQHPVVESQRRLTGNSMASATPSELVFSATPSPQPLADIGGKSVHFSGLSSDGSDDGGHLVVTTDLGDDLDAVVCERGGRLERVITNLRQGAPTLEMMAKLSQELISVSNAIASARVRETSPVGVSDDDKQLIERAMVLGRIPLTSVGTSAANIPSTVPQLLDMIDATATRFDLSCAGSDDSRRLTSSPLHHPPVNSSASSSRATYHPQSRFGPGSLETTAYTIPPNPTIRTISSQPALGSPAPPITITTPTTIASSQPTPPPPPSLPRQQIPSGLSSALGPAVAARTRPGVHRDNSLFTASTCPSPMPSPEMVFANTVRAVADDALTTTQSTSTRASLARADQQVIRQAMRMQRSEAVREAAMMERVMRREKLARGM